ncbi:hypothetical protein ANCDUO_11914 [Ancylostoma duodenale]|uniref:Dual specificity phosphatase catalytic domain-containing protein n=1 Tax=Ancylostoma duodenale TaxID=51022 RepID=A0A0C2GAA3_9BILA|nr:hypothetical protein ANCDUO_11914 [Ancylostoma duodenale]
MLPIRAQPFLNTLHLSENRATMRYKHSQELVFESYSASPPDWEAAGVEFHDIPMTDFFGSAGRAQAGRTRSATVATCYLMKTRNWLPNVAVEFLKSKRPQPSQV